MAVDNTHTKYLKGADKTAWQNYKKAYEAQQKLNNFVDNFLPPKELAEGEVYEIPVRKDKDKNKE